MESKRPTIWEAPPEAPKGLPMPRLCLRPGEEGADRRLAEMACAGCVPGGCALAIGWEPGRAQEGRR